MPPTKKKQRIASTPKQEASLDDEDEEQPIAALAAKSVAPHILDPATSDICRRFLTLAKEVGSLPEGIYTPVQDGGEWFEVRFREREGGGEGEAWVEVLHNTETAPDLSNAAAEARLELENEINKRREDILALGYLVTSLQDEIREGSESESQLGEELIRILKVQGHHRRRIQELLAIREIEVETQGHRTCTKAVVRVDRPTESTETQRRLVSLQKPSLYVLGGEDLSGKALASFEKYSSEGKKWEVMPSMTTVRSRFGALVVNGVLFAMGGLDAFEQCLASVEKYDAPNQVWLHLAPMLVRRACFGVAVLNGHIFVTGGQDDSGFLDRVERYNIESNRWEQVAPLQRRRSGCVAAVLEGQLYVMGGSFYPFIVTPSVERYDVRNNRWEFVRNMKSKREEMAVVVLNNNIYAMGGYSELGRNVSSSMERYDAKRDTWELVASMKTKRKSCAAAVWEGKIYITGGQSESDQTEVMERYDAQKDEWETVVDAPMPRARDSHVAIAALL
eukprot:gb/GEZN01007277.1/.p1 GENE.gb/GEZN01007277.1/~~gb/GEZN01007277.1/.p1  ORF type:complete len:506 (-),score=82.69 gb/GEZN01007277.1/:36-1553(-)